MSDFILDNLTIMW